MIAGLTPHIPNYEHLSLPGPAWLLVLLSTATFWIHLLMVSTVVGTSSILLLRLILGRNRSELDRGLNQRMFKSLPMCISLAINFGVAPLLFTQVLYGRWFYSSSIFIAPFWLATLGVLLVGFISTYLAYTTKGLMSFVFTLLMPLSFLAVYYMLTTNSILSIQPEHWIQYHRGEVTLHVPDAITIPRLLHNLAFIIAIAGLAFAWLSRCKPAVDSQLTQNQIDRHATHIGLQYFFLGTAMLIAFIIWYLQSLPEPLQDILVNIKKFASMAWYASIILIGLAAVSGIHAIFKPIQKTPLIITTILAAASLLCIIIVRQNIRSYYLAREVAGQFDIYNQNAPNGWAVQWQPSGIIAFAILAAISVITITTMLIVIRRRPAQA